MQRGATCGNPGLFDQPWQEDSTQAKLNASYGLRTTNGSSESRNLDDPAFSQRKIPDSAARPIHVADGHTVNQESASLLFDQPGHMDDYLTKPTKPGKNREMLHRWLPPEERKAITRSDLFKNVSGAIQPLDAERLAAWGTVGGNEFVDKILKKFICQALKCVSQVLEAVTTENWENLPPAARGLKGISLGA